MVTVIKAENLPPRKDGECIDPFVDIQLLPFYRRKNHSEVHQKTLNPMFNQTFEFEVPPYEIRGQQIQFTVLDFSQQLNHNTIGTVLYDLTTLDSDALKASKEFILWQRIVKVTLRCNTFNVIAIIIIIISYHISLCMKMIAESS